MVWYIIEIYRYPFGINEIFKNSSKFVGSPEIGLSSKKTKKRMKVVMVKVQTLIFIAQPWRKLKSQ
jgi:hypothetical protein